jgi:hypothetical protein
MASRNPSFDQGAGADGGLEHILQHLRGFHGMPDCFDPDCSQPGLLEGMHEIHSGYHEKLARGEPGSANFGKKSAPHERTDYSPG